MEIPGFSCSSGYGVCNTAGWNYYTNDGYVCTSTVGLGTCNCNTNFGGTDYLCNANAYSDECSSVGWSYGSSSKVTSSTSGSCGSCSRVGTTGYSCSSGYSGCSSVYSSVDFDEQDYPCSPSSLTCSNCNHVGNTGITCTCYIMLNCRLGVLECKWAAIQVKVSVGAAFQLHNLALL